MHDSFADYIRHGQALAEQKGLEWEFELDDEGRVFPGWNLTEMAGGHPPTWHLRDLGNDHKIVKFLNIELAEVESPPILKTRLSKDWQNLIKAATCDQIYSRRNTPGHVYQSVIRSLKVLATLAGKVEPWQVTPDIVQSALDSARKAQASGALADGILGITKTVFDANHLAITCPIYPFLSVTKRVMPSRKSRAVKSKEELQDDLDQRKRAERLPEKRAFWELIRILFTEEPKSFNHGLRFAALKTMVLCGLRVGEAVLLPEDWKRHRDYYDPNGRPAGELGGFSRSLMLRHFAEKQQSALTSSTVLFEATQPIPEIFAEILEETLDEVVRITSPLRQTLRMQVESGRLFPWYNPKDLIPVNEAYRHMTGNPFWVEKSKEDILQYANRYRQCKFDPIILDEIDNDLYRGALDGLHASMAMYMFFRRLNDSRNAPNLQFSGGERADVKDIWNSSYDVFVKVGEIEEYLTKNVPSKLPDLKPMKMQNGDLQAWELLFISPKRSLTEERNDSITDVTKYFSVGKPDFTMLMHFLGVEKDIGKTIFEHYGHSDDDKHLVLKSHSLRHLQNTELFRLGVADTIITKRFNRKSVAQSYEYDHRSLAEQLDSIELPPDVEIALGANASTVARLIKTGKATGPIVDSFKRIQLEEGDEAALDFLKVEADGFHATPYGHCINSFTVDPCPKNLECFNGCCHLTATNLPENRRHLKNLESRLQSALEEVSARPMNSIGKTNQIAHATVRLDAVRKLQATPNGQIVFPDGPDLSLPYSTRSVLDVG